MNLAKTLLNEIFGHDFSSVSSEGFHKAFYAKQLTLADLHKVYNFLQDQSFKNVQAVMLIDPETSDDEPALLLAQLHGNEPAGLASILHTLALNEAGLLRKPVLVVIGNNYAAGQYFAALQENANSSQASRDVYRRGVDADGRMLADMNRVPLNFRELDPTLAPANKRWLELDALTDLACGIVDIHSARGNLVCMTESSDDRMLRYSPIRFIMYGLTGAIDSATNSETFKTIAKNKPNIRFQYGIEAGTHEDITAFKIAAQFTEALFYNLGFSSLKPSADNDNGKFKVYNVQKALKYSDLIASAQIGADEIFYSAKEKSEGSKIICPIFKGKFGIVNPENYNGETPAYSIYQFDEAEVVEKGQLLAVSVPDGVELRAPFAFSGVFYTKSAELFSDPAIGLYPVTTDKLNTKFCYPCIVTDKQIEF